MTENLVKIEIQQICNGFVIDLFATEGEQDLDMVVFCETFEEVLKKISEWKKIQDGKDE